MNNKAIVKVYCGNYHTFLNDLMRAVIYCEMSCLETPSCETEELMFSNRKRWRDDKKY